MNPILNVLPKAKRWALVLAIIFSVMAIVTVTSIIGPIIFTIMTIFLFWFYSACNRLEISNNSDDLLAACKAQKGFLLTQAVLGLLLVVLFVVMLFMGVGHYNSYIRDANTVLQHQNQ